MEPSRPSTVGTCADSSRFTALNDADKRRWACVRVFVPAVPGDVYENEHRRRIVGAVAADAIGAPSRYVPRQRSDYPSGWHELVPLRELSFLNAEVARELALERGYSVDVVERALAEATAVNSAFTGSGELPAYSFVRERWRSSLEQVTASAAAPAERPTGSRQRRAPRTVSEAAAPPTPTDTKEPD